MKHRFPRSYFSTPLSGSDSLVKQRIQNLMESPKKRPPTAVIALAVLAIALCGNLVSCQSAQTPQVPDTSQVHSGLSVPADQSQGAPDGSAGEVLLRADVSGGGEFLVTLEDAPEGEQYMSDQVGALCYRAPGGEDIRIIAYLDYGPEHHYWNSVSLEPFTGVLGYDGAVLRYEIGAAWAGIDYYGLVDGQPQLIATCYNTSFQVDLDGDGAPELLSNYHASGFLDVFQRQDDGQVLCWQLNDAARELLGQEEDTWVSLNALDLKDDPDAAVTAEWRDESGNWVSWELEPGALFLAAKAEDPPENGELLERTLPTASGRTLTLRCAVQSLDEYAVGVDRVEVWEGDTLLQAIVVADDLPPEDVSMLRDGRYTETWQADTALLLADLDLDGTEDLGLMGWVTNGANLPYWFWLWDEEAGQFRYCCQLCNPEPDPASGLVACALRDGQEHYTEYYRVTKEGAELVRRVSEDQPDAAG